MCMFLIFVLITWHVEVCVLLGLLLQMYLLSELALWVCNKLLGGMYLCSMMHPACSACSVKVPVSKYHAF